ncbi:hypothetical protein A2V49_01565 [candidate division WWE3 bacterium RBG_19FT_COMBO_34_6]|uniref:Uncharacterized protein n=1 Tax=candidate division WWE3 bacterium RBG_19FT_COMBO_34_6 TaxID=1802612 RepID=A0A1F4UJW0_UNCKA|nr:MAG: hypothetical protein A2V49_01565 [candidate division WWE3 bacterium RBG_19FT_COMBO_34_6]
MTGYFQIDREEVPSVFYTPKSTTNHHGVKPGQVLTVSSQHQSSGWVCLGYVCKQTPFGQGIFMGFPIGELRIATPDEIRASLKTNHPHGQEFRPHCQEAMDASFHLLMSSAIGNWTNDNEQSSGHRSILGVSQKDIQGFGEQAMAKHQKIMDNWSKITDHQAKAILKKFKGR